MGQIFFDTAGAATNSGSSDVNTPDLSGTNATVSTNVVTLDGSPDLSGVQTSGANQASIALAQATNANRKIFWITAVDNTAKTVTVDVAPTGVSGSGWAIGGRMVYTSANFEGAVRAGDVLTFNNSPASKAADFITCRAMGSSAAGWIKVRGKAGVRPVLTVTNTTQVIEGGNQDFWWFENLEFAQQGASGNVVQALGDCAVIYNVKISDGGGNGINASVDAILIIGCEITGVGGDGIHISAASGFAYGNYIHDLTGSGINISGNQAIAGLSFNIIDTCSGRGIYYSGAASAASAHIQIENNTIYGCGDSGLEVADADAGIRLIGNIFQDNGNAAGEYNVEWVAGAAENVSFHGWNCFYHQGGGGGANLSNLTVNATEITTDPLLTNPAAGDFTLGSSSPCKATGFPGLFLGGSTGHLDMGAVQRQEAGGSGGLLAHPGMRGGFA